MHRLKLVELSEIAPWNWFPDYNALHPACVRAAQGYEATIKRTHGLASCLGQAFMCGEHWMKAAIIADNIHPELDNESQEFKIECLKAFIEVAKWPNQDAYNEDFRRATHNADEHHHLMQPVYEGFYALVQSVVVQAWGAFEVLCDDLWKDVDKAKPHLRQAMSNGQIKELSFRSRGKIRKSYESLFKTDDSEIRAALAPTAIDALAVMRNLLVHSNGHIDDFF